MKQKYITIETPEKIRFEYSITEIGTRIAAYVIDFIIQFFILLLIYLLIIFGVVGSIFSFSDEAFGNLLVAFALLMVFFITWGYFVVFEVIMEGQSPGKKMMRIRVIRSSGVPLDFSTIALRNLLRAVDNFPMLHIVGGLVAMIDKKTRRLGDMIADTLVVNEIQFNLREPDFTVHLSNDDGKIEKLIVKLTENELYIIRRFLNDRVKLPKKKQIDIADRLALQVKDKLKIQEEITDSILFLERVYKEHGS